MKRGKSLTLTKLHHVQESAILKASKAISFQCTVYIIMINHHFFLTFLKKMNFLTLKLFKYLYPRVVTLCLSLQHNCGHVKKIGTHDLNMTRSPPNIISNSYTDKRCDVINGSLGIIRFQKQLFLVRILCILIKQNFCNVVVLTEEF